MGKTLVLTMVVAVAAFLGYQQFGSKPVDVRDAIDAGVEGLKQTEKLDAKEEQILRIQLAIMDHMARTGAPPASLNELVPLYFDSIPMDPETKEPVEYVRKGTQYRIGPDTAEEIKVAQAEGDEEEEEVSLLDGIDLGEEFVNPNTMKQVAFIYDTSGKKDPFRPFNLSDQLPENDCGPLGNYDLGQLKVTAILAKANGSYTAIVEDAAGKGYTVRPGTKMGRGCSEVISIEEDRLKILHRKFDFTGKLSETPLEMKIVSAGG